MSVQKEKIENCPICGDHKLRFWNNGKDRLHLISSQEFIYKRCIHCRALILVDRPLESEIGQFYPIDYGPYHGKEFLETGKKARIKNKPKAFKYIKHLAYFLSRPINFFFSKTSQDKLVIKVDQFYKTQANLNFLDFGCGSEHFLNRVRENKWNTTGMDFSPMAIDSVIKHGHRGILYADETAWSNIEDNSIDIIRMNHVVEHLYNPKLVIVNLWKKLKKGGQIHIATPNSGSITAFIFKKFWRGLECPRHIVIYTPESLTMVLKETGFTKVSIHHETLSKDFVRSLGLWEHEKGWIPHNEIESKINDKKLREILRVPAIIIRNLKRSDRIHAFAEK